MLESEALKTPMLSSEGITRPKRDFLKSPDGTLPTKETIITTINNPEGDEKETFLKSCNLKDLEEKIFYRGTK